MGNTHKHTGHTTVHTLNFFLLRTDRLQEESKTLSSMAALHCKRGQCLMLILQQWPKIELYSNLNIVQYRTVQYRQYPTVQV